MTQEEKCEMLKNTIFQLYTNEGRSKSYISRLLEVDRKTLSDKINNEWGFQKNNSVRYMRPSTEKSLKKHKDKIISMLNQDRDIKEIANVIGISDNIIEWTFADNDSDIRKAIADKHERASLRASLRKEEKKKYSGRNYSFSDLDGEMWKDILGFNGYMVSNKGRVKHYIKEYDDYCLLSPALNESNGRYYIGITDSSGKKRNLNLARIVAHAFCDGYSDDKNTVNHIDGDSHNNCADNLEWVSQSENNEHSYRESGRKKNVGKPIDYIILYKHRYSFKTIAAFARFANISWTQASRWIKEPEKHEIEIVNKHNCND